MKKEIRQAFEFDGNFYTLTAKCFDLMALSLYWLAGCLPVVTAGASFSALYAAVSRSVRQDVGTVSQKFWTAYRRDLKASIPLWLLALGALAALLLNIGILLEKASVPAGLFFVLFYGLAVLVLLTAACYAFPALSRFDMPVGWIVKLSFYLTFRHLPVSLLVLMLLAVSYLALLRAPMLFLIVPGMSALVSSFLIDPLLDRHMPREDAAQATRGPG